MLDEARARHAYPCMWEQSEVTRTDTMAVRLLVSEAPAVSWEMALRPKGDPRLFIENQISGFVTDGATGCFADAGAWEPLLALFEKVMAQAEPDLDPDVYENINDSMYLLRTQTMPPAASWRPSQRQGTAPIPSGSAAPKPARWSRS